MADKILRHVRAHFVGYLALVIALGGTAYAAGGHINGRSIKKNSLPGNRLKANSVTGKQVKESALDKVPNAGHSDSAGSADQAANAAALDGVARQGFGQGIVSGAILNVPNGTLLAPPYGLFNTAGAGATADFSVAAFAPDDMIVRDFVGSAALGFSSNMTVDFKLRVADPSTGVTTTPLCEVSASATKCRANGPISIPRDDEYRLAVLGTNLPGAPSGVDVGFQYRTAAG